MKKKEVKIDPVKVTGAFRIFLSKVGRDFFKKLENMEKRRILSIISWEIEKIKETISKEEREEERKKRKK